MKKMIIGIDLGGTHLRIGAVDQKNCLVEPEKMKTAVIADADDPVKEMCLLIHNYMIEHEIKDLEAISIGVPSSVENDKETVICTTNIRNRNGKIVFENINIAEKIRKEFRVPVYINNDVKNIMLYDIVQNHLEHKKIVVGIYIGTGVGAAVMVGGKFLEGKNGAEMDLGHIPYFRGDVPCSCGKTGCCECYASGWRLQKIREEKYPDTSIGDMFLLHKEEKPLQDFVDACAKVYALMATIFNPDAVIVGGGVIEMPGFPIQRFEEAVNTNTGKDVMTYGFDYVYSQESLGKGIIGAAIFARKMILGEL